jgi:hypothetical protein
LQHYRVEIIHNVGIVGRSFKYANQTLSKRSLAMKSRILSAAAIILLTPMVVLAFQAQAEQVRYRELKNKSFTAGSLKITITSFTFGNISIEVENTSDDFTMFSPQLLAFIDKDNNQDNIVGQYSGSELVGTDVTATVVAVGDQRVWPRARIKHIFIRFQIWYICRRACSMVRSYLRQ